MTSGRNAPQSELRQSAQYSKTAGLDRGSYTERYVRENDQFDARCYRPLHVSVQLDVTDIQAHLVKVKC